MDSDAISCPFFNLNTLWYIIMTLHSYVEQVMTMRRIYSNANSCLHIFWVISPW